MQSPIPRKPRQLTGRTVLACFLGFFGVVFAVNAFMIREAVSTFGGVETGNAYKAGLAYGQELAAASEQAQRHWQVTAEIKRDPAGDAVVELAARDGNGAPLSSLTAVARLAHPADARRDRVVTLDRVGAGRFRGMTEAEPGLWTVQIDLERDGERVFRSRTKLVLR
jgi:nitrogen fixation protein FixH